VGPCQRRVLRSGRVDLDHPHPLPAQVGGQPGPVGPGALDPDQQQPPEPAQPAEQLGVAGPVAGNVSWPGIRPAVSITAAVWVSTPQTTSRSPTGEPAVAGPVCAVGVTGRFVRAIVGLAVLTLDRAGRHAPAGRADKTVMGAW
jgi:hypothetical protein